MSRGDRGALGSSGAYHAVPGFEAVSFRGDPDGAALTVADTEEFHLRSTTRRRPAAATEESTEGGSPWR